MSEARAKIHLRDEVIAADVDNAIEMLLDSFIQSQKSSVARQLSKKFEKYRMRQTDTSQLLLHVLQKIMQNRAQYNRVVQGIDEHEKIQVKIALNYFESEARDYDRGNMVEFYNDERFKRSYRMEGNEIVTLHKI